MKGTEYFDEMYSRLVSVEADSEAINHVGQHDWNKMQSYFDEARFVGKNQDMDEYNVRWGDRHFVMRVHACSDGEEIYNPSFAVVDDNFSCS